MAIVVYWRPQIGLGAFLDRAGDVDHPLVAGARREHLAAGEDAVEHGDDAAGDGDEHNRFMIIFPVRRQVGKAGDADAAGGLARPLWGKGGLQPA